MLINLRFTSPFYSRYSPSQKKHSERKSDFERTVIFVYAEQIRRRFWEGHFTKL